MAEGQRMTSAYVVAQLRDGRLEDFVCEAVVVLVARELMEAEISAEIGAERDEVAPIAAHRVRLRRRRVRQGRHGDALPGRAAMSPTAASKPPSRWSFRSVGPPMSGATREPGQPPVHPDSRFTGRIDWVRIDVDAAAADEDHLISREGRLHLDGKAVAGVTAPPPPPRLVCDSLGGPIVCRPACHQPRARVMTSRS
jgi:hypothetical protein